MTDTPVLLPALVAIGVLMVCLTAATVARRAVRRRAERRRVALTGTVRPVLMRLVAGTAPQVEAAIADLVSLDPATWRAVEPDLESLLLKVRGETHDAVVAVLERRGTLARAVAATRARSAVTRARAAEVLGAARRQDAVPHCVALLTDPDAEVRLVAARALGRIGSGEAAGPLLAAIGGDTSVPPRVVATALLRLGVSAHPALVAAIADGDTLRRAIAAEIAGLDQAVAAVPALLRALRDDPDLEVRIRCARALGRIGVPSALDPLVAATRPDAPPALRAVAARALGDLGWADAVPHLAPLLADPVFRVCANAAAALARCGAVGLLALRERATAGNQHALEALAHAELRRPVAARAAA